MNKSVLNKDVQDFINTHLKSDIAKLILKGSPFRGVSIQELATQIVAKAKCEKKLPTWFGTEGIYYPNRLNIEQASSETTARYKANLVGKAKTLIDLTGGFGVDSYYFSKTCDKVVYCEMNSELADTVSCNFKVLETVNIQLVVEDGIQYLKKLNIKYAWIYIDPSRRDSSAKKVFFLNQCSPDLTTHLDLLFKYSNNILVKLSPLLDVTKTIADLKYVKEVHCVAVKNEMKELLFVLEKNYTNQTKIVTINFIYNDFQRFVYHINKVSNIKYNFIMKYLYEPNVAVLKSGGYKHFSESYNLYKLHKNTHLFTSDTLVDFSGRRFEVLEVLDFDKKNIKSKLSNTQANIATRNFPLSVAEIRKKFKIKDGGDIYLFFMTSIENKLQLVKCKKV